MLRIHFKNTCVDHTQVCVFQNATLLPYMKDTLLCQFNTSTSVEMTTQVLCARCSMHLKTVCRQKEANLRSHTPEADVLFSQLTTITGAYYDDTIIIITVTLEII